MSPNAKSHQTMSQEPYVSHTASADTLTLDLPLFLAFWDVVKPQQIYSFSVLFTIKIQIVVSTHALSKDTPLTPF